MKPEVVFGYATFPDGTVADVVCERLVKEGLIACANILSPHRAIYVWQGELNNVPEVAAILKTDRARVQKLTERFRSLHPYDMAPLAFFDVTDGEPAFLKWIVGG